MSGRRTSDGALLWFYERMLLIRETEAQLGQLFRDGKVPGFIHLSIGQEATAVGIAEALRTDDTIASTHRGHGHALAKGMSPSALVHEIRGNVEGPCQGRGGSLHVADFSVGMLGANGIVGAGIPIALGSALAHKTQKNGCVAVAFFGDGAMAQGLLYESFNLSKLWNLPLLFACENNGWSEFTPTSMQYVGRLQALAGAFGIIHEQVDGNDVEAVHKAAQGLVARLRKGEGPAVLECITSRVKGHYEGDPQKYRQGVDEAKALDPLDVVLSRLRQSRTPAAEIDAVAARVNETVQAAVAEAMGGRQPEFDAASNDVYGAAP